MLSSHEKILGKLKITKEDLKKSAIEKVNLYFPNYTPVQKEFLAETMYISSVGMLCNERPIEYTKELKEDEIQNLKVDIKNILEEEKIPTEKHDAFIDMMTQSIQQTIHVVNTMTLENKDAEEFKNYSKDYALALEKLGYSETHPDFVRVNDRLTKLPLIWKIKIEAAYKVSELTAESLSNQFPNMDPDSPDTSDDDDDESAIQEIRGHLLNASEQHKEILDKVINESDVKFKQELEEYKRNRR